MTELDDEEVALCLAMLREISERPRCNRVKLAALVAVAWAMGALMGMGL
jgi:hypothetical protein